VGDRATPSSRRGSSPPRPRPMARKAGPGFSLDAVARGAGIGKSTLYARWTSAEDLLAAMIEQRWSVVATIDTGDLQRDLCAFGSLVLARYLETGGGVARHLRRDLTTYPELAERIGPVVDFWRLRWPLPSCGAPARAGNCAKGSVLHSHQTCCCPLWRTARRAGSHRGDAR